jgi:hypothetical protein
MVPYNSCSVSGGGSAVLFDGRADDRDVPIETARGDGIIRDWHDLSRSRSASPGSTVVRTCRCGRRRFRGTTRDEIAHEAGR